MLPKEPIRAHQDPIGDQYPQLQHNFVMRGVYESLSEWVLCVWHQRVVVRLLMYSRNKTLLTHFGFSLSICFGLSFLSYLV